MEPIVLMGLIVVVYGGYVSIADWLHNSLSGELNRRVSRSSGLVEHPKPLVKQMARMHV